MANNEDDDSAFNAITRAFKANPTVENYVDLRRKHPDEVIQVHTTSDIEWLFSNQDVLEAFDIPPQLVANTLDADQESISELSLILLEKLIDRKKALKAGETHLLRRGKAISDGLVNYLISMILDSLDWNDHRASHSSVVNELDCRQVSSDDFESPAEMQRAINLNTLVVLQWYRKSSVGFLFYAAPDLESLGAWLERLYPEEAKPRPPKPEPPKVELRRDSKIRPV